MSTTEQNNEEPYQMTYATELQFIAPEDLTSSWIAFDVREDGSITNVLVGTESENNIARYIATPSDILRLISDSAIALNDAKLPSEEKLDSAQAWADRLLGDGSDFADLLANVRNSIRKYGLSELRLARAMVAVIHGQEVCGRSNMPAYVRRRMLFACHSERSDVATSILVFQRLLQAAIESYDSSIAKNI